MRSAASSGTSTPATILRIDQSRTRNPREGVDEVADIQELTAGGTVVGMFPDMDYEESPPSCHSGDVLLAFTDGVTEAHSPDQEEFGEERLKAVLARVAHLSADQSARTLQLNSNCGSRTPSSTTI